MNFMHFHNSSTRNCDDHTLLIMTGNAHKESCHKVSLILIREQGLYIIETDCSSQMVVAFAIKEKNYLMVSYFPNWCCPIPIYICGIKFLIWLRYWSSLWHSDKSGYCSLYIQFYKLLWLWFYVDFFLNFEFYYNAVEQCFPTSGLWFISGS